MPRGRHKMDLIENINDAENHWYYKHKYFYISKYLKLFSKGNAKINDVGAGSAVFSKKLLQEKIVKTVVASDINYEKELKQKIINMEFSKNPVAANIYLLTDVLEHLANPKILLDSILEIAPKDAILIITVPAHKSLWSGHDVYLKHYRRYSISSLRTLMSSVDVKEYHIQYLFTSLYLPVYIYRKITKNKVESQLKNRNFYVENIIDSILKIERKLNWKFPFGISIIAIYKFNNKQN